VKNGNDGVHIFFNCERDIAQQFFEQVKCNYPPLAKVTSCTLIKTNEFFYPDFSIFIEDDSNEAKEVLISPDIALCTQCKEEL
jgi:hydrogenase maturation factor HypF (carbamoyltransferase family)